MKYRNLHIGNLIREKMEEKGMSVTQFANAIYCSRSNVYHLLSSKSIDIDKLLLISNVLEHNFLKEYESNVPPEQQIKIILELEQKDGKIVLKNISD